MEDGKKFCDVKGFFFEVVGIVYFDIERNIWVYRFNL